ncbi:type II CAAX prenyl endopeptidase Rce1 family protein [Pelistega ratti]|uniref:CPBP family glutamic-type intramembrane protease n=1 Tax=Pelistega ratti TaxID=2652177 RepID=UPI00135BEFBA|nr:CPBP family glutamic-type intramembrane protease [Pelistega ratti]
MTFKEDLKSFLHYIRHPHLNYRLPYRIGDGWWNDIIKIHTPFRLLLKWVFFLLTVNIFIFGPIALVVATQIGASNRLNINIPYLFLLAAIWAPIVEEFLFRFGLRKPKMALYIVPLLTSVILMGRGVLSIGIVVVLLSLLLILDLSRQTGNKQALPFKWRRWYRHYFPWFFHGSVLLFAMMHLGNYDFKQGISFLLLPLLILPQWLSGLVLAWMRVRDSFACAVVMHSLFNGIPVLFAWLIKTFLPLEQVSLIFF